MRDDGAVIAFFGAMTLQAKELRALLESRAFLASEVRLWDASAEGAVTEFAGEAMVVTVPDEESLGDLDIAFFCGGTEEMAPYLDWPARRGFVAVDLSGASRRAGAPLIHSGINPGDLVGPAGAAAPIIAVPHAIAHNLASLVSSARAAGRIAAVEALALRPAADLGDAGIDELYQQTVSLLNFASLPQEVFGRQMAFNIVPADGIERGAREASDLRLHAEAARLLGLEDSQLSIRSAFMPLFHGHVLSVTLTFERAPEAAALDEALSGSGGVKRADLEGVSSPVDLAGEERVAIFEMRADPFLPRRVSLWTFCDNLKGGSTLNAVHVAERLAALRTGRPS